MDRGSNAVSTDSTGFYDFESGYPLAEWLIMEAYSDSFYTTGVTYQADNQPTPTTILGSGVDVSILPIIGLSGTVDWGVQKYDAAGTKGGPRNGGIVGSISYDTTRNELDPQYAAAEDWQPGVPNIPVKLYATVDCPTSGTTPCDPTDTYALNADGSYQKGDLLNTYVSENWSRPTGCTARDVDGKPFSHPGDEDVLVPTQSTDGECLSALVNGVQIGAYAADQGTPDASFGATVDGNYGFGDGCFTGTLDATDPGAPTCTDGQGNDAFEPLPGGRDYLVQIDIPNDQSGSPMYSVTSEEDINIARGDTVVPQVPPPSCAGALHTVDVADGNDGHDAIVGNGSNGVPVGVTVPKSTPVDNPTFTDMGGSPYEGMPKARCDTKLVQLNNGKSIVPMFNVFTDVPIPSRLRGLIVDDLNFSVDKRTTLYGDKAGVPTHRSASTTSTTASSTRPSPTSTASTTCSCPRPTTSPADPSGVCTGMYRFVGNDPGVPGALNANYNPRFRTIATEFEAMPGVTIPTDLAPTRWASASAPRHEPDLRVVPGQSGAAPAVLGVQAVRPLTTPAPTAASPSTAWASAARAARAPSPSTASPCRRPPTSPGPTRRSSSPSRQSARVSRRAPTTSSSRAATARSRSTALRSTCSVGPAAPTTRRCSKSVRACPWPSTTRTSRPATPAPPGSATPSRTRSTTRRLATPSSSSTPTRPWQ